MSLTEELTELVTSKPVSDDDLRVASLFVLDALATAYAGRNTPVGQLFIRWAGRNAKDAGRRAFVMGALTHITETDDLHRASVTHPGCVVVPSVLAVVERDGHSGRELLQAVLHGFETMCRVGSSVGQAHYRVWHNTATCGPFGSAQAVASLLGLGVQQTVHALGNAGTQSSGLWQFMENGAMSKHLHAGRAAESGLLAADLAALGVTGPPHILEGEKGFYKATCTDPLPAALLANPDDDWQLRKTSIKPWPCCRHTHPAVDAALELSAGLKGVPIERVCVGTYPAALDVCDRPDPDSEYAAKFSLQHCVAMALLEGKLGLSSFDAAARQAGRFVRGVIEVRREEPYASNYPAAWGSRVSVTTRSGDEVVAERLHCKGDPEMPLDAAEMQRKALSLMRFSGISDDDGEANCRAVLELPNSDRPAALLSALLD